MKKLFTLLSVTMLFVGLNASALEKAETPDINAETASLANDFYAKKPVYEKVKADISNTWNEAKERAKAKYHEYKADWYKNK